ncbi:hypothetical protein TGPRC2_313750 [Toxoplasma gondii TgCatPRC2]|uniref:Uncharacterized protein n=1 Tax=Toxoplasma gondii TgCatPRC2 TaxID=1130821 RepID=A0A151H7U3_TOXGO|nr:hypothetical protein TGPRC2_313750 [Toxoplasma gondii TgCatPRC2]
MFAAHTSVATQIQPQQAAAGILPYGDCLLLLALKEALHKLSTQAFIRHDVAQTIAQVAQQELIALLVRSAPSLPSICLTGRLLLYRHRQQHWLLVLQSVRAATLSPASLSPQSASGSSSTPADISTKTRQRGEVVMAYLRRFLPKDKREGIRALQGGAVVKYNLPGFTPSHRQTVPEAPVEDKKESVCSQEGSSSCSVGGKESMQETTAAATGAGTEPLTCGPLTSSSATRAAAPSSEAPPTEPALDGVTYFSHDGVLRASVPFSNLPQISAVVSAALAATGGGSAQTQEGKKRKV